MRNLNPLPVRENGVHSTGKTAMGMKLLYMLPIKHGMMATWTLLLWKPIWLIL